MSSSAIIKIDKTPLCVYTHWNGTFADISAYACYARLRNFGSPDVDPSGITGLIQVMANCLEGGYGLEVMPYGDADGRKTDNGTFVLEGWEVIDIEGNRGSAHGLDDDLIERVVRIDACQPPTMQMGDGFIREVSGNGSTFAGELAVGDVIWDRGEGVAPVRATIVGFGDSGYPYVHVDVDPAGPDGRPQVPDHYAREHFGRFLGNPTWFARIPELSHPQAKASAFRGRPAELNGAGQIGLRAKEVEAAEEHFEDPRIFPETEDIDEIDDLEAAGGAADGLAGLGVADGLAQAHDDTLEPVPAGGTTAASDEALGTTGDDEEPVTIGDDGDDVLAATGDTETETATGTETETEMEAEFEPTEEEPELTGASEATGADEETAQEGVDALDADLDTNDEMTDDETEADAEDADAADEAAGADDVSDEDAAGETAEGTLVADDVSWEEFDPGVLIDEHASTVVIGDEIPDLPLDDASPYGDVSAAEEARISETVPTIPFGNAGGATFPMDPIAFDDGLGGPDEPDDLSDTGLIRMVAEAGGDEDDAYLTNSFVIPTDASGSATETVVELLNQADDEPNMVMTSLSEDTSNLKIVQPLDQDEETIEAVIAPSTSDTEGRSVVITPDLSEIEPDLSTDETAKNPLPYPDVMDAEFEPYEGE